MKTIMPRLFNVGFFIGGDAIYGLFAFGHERSAAVFFGMTIVILLFFALHKLDKLFEDSPSKKLAVTEKRYTEWLLSVFLGAGFAFASNGSTLLRWANLSS